MNAVEADIAGVMVALPQLETIAMCFYYPLTVGMV
jgi:hypothetical protein